MGNKKDWPEKLLRNSCRPLKRTRFIPLSASRHFYAGLSHAAASHLGSIWSDCRD